MNTASAQTPTNDELIQRINEKITKLEQLIKDYGSFNIVANSILRNSSWYSTINGSSFREGNPVVQEYLALVSLKFPFALGIGELINSKDVPKNYSEINQLGLEIVMLHAALHGRQFNVFDETGEYPKWIKLLI